jgi:hypothetical protein
VDIGILCRVGMVAEQHVHANTHTHQPKKKKKRKKKRMAFQAKETEETNNVQAR